MRNGNAEGNGMLGVDKVAKRIVYGDKSDPVYDELYKNYIISLLRDLKIINAVDFKRKTGLKLRKLGEGLDRIVYRVEDSNLVVKFCRFERDRLDRSGQSYAEYSSWKTIMRSKKKYKSLQKYMPEIYYFNAITGVTLVKMYHKITFGEAQKVNHSINAAFYSVLGNLSDADLHEHNIGYDTDFSIKVIDLGLVYL